MICDDRLNWNMIDEKTKDMTEEEIRDFFHKFDTEEEDIKQYYYK